MAVRKNCLWFILFLVGRSDGFVFHRSSQTQIGRRTLNAKKIKYHGRITSVQWRDRTYNNEISIVTNEMPSYEKEADTFMLKSSPRKSDQFELKRKPKDEREAIRWVIESIEKILLQERKTKNDELSNELGHISVNTNSDDLSLLIALKQIYQGKAI